MTSRPQCYIGDKGSAFFGAGIIRHDIAQPLKTTSKRTTINVHTLNGERETAVDRYLYLKIRGYKGKESLHLEVYYWNELSSNLQSNLLIFNLGQIAGELPPKVDIPIEQCKSAKIAWMPLLL